MTSLRQTAAYVQSVASQDLVLLLSSGFQSTSTNRAQVPLPKPVVLSVDNSMSGRFVVRLQSMANARAYEVQYKNGGGWLPAGIFTQGRRIEIGNLTPGQSYTVQAGDSWEGIADQVYDTDAMASQIIRLNLGAKLTPGAHLRMPAAY